MRSDDVMKILGCLERAGVSVWVDGGWGVDALVGSQTREHGDLDLAVDSTNLERARGALQAIGFRQVTDAYPGLPARLVLRDAREREIDLHPLHFDLYGNGWQQLSEAGDSWGRYGAEHLRATGTIGGLTVRCLSAELQVRFHQGYEEREVDRHDLGLLARLVAGPQQPA